MVTFAECGNDDMTLLQSLQDAAYSRVAFVLRRDGDSAHVKDTESLLRSYLGIPLGKFSFGDPLLRAAELVNRWVPSFKQENGALTKTVHSQGFPAPS